MSRTFSRVKPLRPKEPTTDWDFVGLKYWTRNGNPKSPKVRQEVRVELHYHVPPPKKRRRRVSGAVRETPNAARMRYLRKEQADLMEGLKAQVEATEGSITPVRRRELAAGFAAAGMAHLVF